MIPARLSPMLYPIFVGIVEPKSTSSSASSRSSSISSAMLRFPVGKTITRAARTVMK